MNREHRQTVLPCAVIVAWLCVSCLAAFAPVLLGAQVSTAPNPANRSSTNTAAAAATSNQLASVTLAFDASPDTKVVGYKIHIGVKSGTYTNSLLIGTNLIVTLTNLQRGVRYYFAATAFDKFGGESRINSSTLLIANTNQP